MENTTDERFLYSFDDIIGYEDWQLDTLHCILSKADMFKKITCRRTRYSCYLYEGHLRNLISCKYDRACFVNKKLKEIGVIGPKAKYK